MGAPFSKGEIVRDSWRLTKEHYGFLFLSYVIYFAFRLPFLIASGILAYVAASTHATSLTLGLGRAFFEIAGAVVGLLVTVGQVRASLEIVRGGRPEWTILYRQYPLLLPMIGASILYMLGFAAGLVFLIVPGIVVLLGWSQYLFTLVDGHPGPVSSLKRSWELTKGIKGQVCLLFLIVLGINLLGALALLVGLLFTVPLSLVISARTYEALRLRAEAPPADAPAPAV